MSGWGDEDADWSASADNGSAWGAPADGGWGAPEPKKQDEPLPAKKEPEPRNEPAKGWGNEDEVWSKPEAQSKSKSPKNEQWGGDDGWGTPAAANDGWKSKNDSGKSENGWGDSGDAWGSAPERKNSRQREDRGRGQRQERRRDDRGWDDDSGRGESRRNDRGNRGHSPRDKSDRRRGDGDYNNRGRSRENDRGFSGRSRDDDFGSSFGDDRGDRPVLQAKYADKQNYRDESPRSSERTKERNPRLEKVLFGVDDEKFSMGINFDKYDKIPASTTGTDVPDPIDRFEDMGLPQALLDDVALCKYVKPTPIQKHGIPIGLEGRDLMACAQTGSGKTAAFLLCVLPAMMKNMVDEDEEDRSVKRRVQPRALIMAPTRELAIQIFQESRKFTYLTGLRPVVCYGGRNIRNQIRDLGKGCDLLVATPGRLRDLCDRGEVSFANIAHLILDEADRMLDMGFEPQIRSLIDGYDMPGVENRQTLMFSATFPEDIRRLARDFLKDYIFLTIGRVGSTTDNITQKLLKCENFEKNERLIELLNDCSGLTLIFVATKRTADDLEDDLSEMGVNTCAIHGDRTQQDREFALRQFRSGRCPVLVATDVAARGWDIPNVKQVINYDLPSNIDDYIHRIGRTGRAGNTGTAISFINNSNMNIYEDLITTLKDTGQDIPDWIDDVRDGRGSRGGRFGGRGRGRGRGGRRGRDRDQGNDDWGDNGNDNDDGW